jgi:hypothetical protein
MPPVSAASTIRLIRHPATPGDAVRSVGARVGRMPGGLLALTYCIEGQLERVRIPPRAASRRAERLWQHTCCEAFIACEGSTAYHELNFSPSGEWAAYRFARYREGGPLENALNPLITLRAAADRLELDATVRLEALSPALSSSPLALALAAVVEESDGVLTYWALRHPADKPDFHHPEAFVLELDEAQ